MVVFKQYCWRGNTISPPTNYHSEHFRNSLFNFSKGTNLKKNWETQIKKTCKSKKKDKKKANFNFFLLN